MRSPPAALPLRGSLPPRLAGLRPAAAATRRAAAAAPCRAAAAGGVPVRFVLTREVSFGRGHSVVGDHPALGGWDAAAAPAMAWGEGHRWSAEVVLAPGTSLEFKCVELQDGGGAKWEGGDNRAVTVPDGAEGPVEIVLEWGRGGAGKAVKAAKAAARAAPAEVAGGAPGGGGVTSDDDAVPGSQWAGREVVFMQSNDHSTERRGVWETAGLEGEALQVVEGDREAGSWLRKLEVAKSVLVDSAPAMRPTLSGLAHSYVYLTWVATGALPCVESGGHRRPNHHAQASRATFRSLEWVVGERGGSADALLARRLHTRLPSFTEAFTQSVPLTRIRDIAHRGDIPHALKQEIKHTIQNKLHRNAGPEDLEATAAMLARVTANPGEYPQAFVSELRTFLSELRDFFNAGSLGDMLGALRPAMDDPSAQLTDHFLATKAKLDAAGAGADDGALMDALHAATGLRALLAAGLASGLRNDAPDAAMAARQRWRLAEVRAEDYAFVLLSRFINALEGRGGAGALAGGTDGAWGLPLGAMVLALRHLGLSGFEPAECMAVEQELGAWQRLGGLQHRPEALRLKASLLRAQRLAGAYSQLLLDTLAGPAAALGGALGVGEERSAGFTEAEIRASVVFQLSKLTSLLLKAATQVSGGSSWDVVVAGDATGVLLEAPSLAPGCLAAAGGRPAILVVGAATGDEEVGALGSALAGVILRHEIPHLSHLGVRARQESVPFAACEVAEVVDAAVAPLLGALVTLRASPDGGVALERASSEAAAGSGNGAAAAAKAAAAPAAAVPAAVTLAKAFGCVPLADATVATCGAKAAACGELLRLAAACEGALLEAGGRGDGAAPVFEAPDGVCLPFGCMEAAVAADGKAGALEAALAAADAAVGAAQRGEPGAAAALDARCAEVEAVVAGVALPAEELRRVAAAFPRGCTLIVRSSANVEDLAGMSGAGLYESVPNVGAGDAAALGAAVRRVWASLHARRALLARAAAGVPPRAARMAVAVQRQLAPELSFVLHTAHPLTGDAGVLAAELAPGLGETLASGTRGSGWRLEVDKATGDVSTLAFANFSQALLPAGGAPADVSAAAAAAAGGGGGASLAAAVAARRAAAPGGDGAVAARVVDYSAQELSWSEDARAAAGRRLCAVGRLLEAEFGAAQDVEGCVAGGRLYVVQTRPQP